MHLEGLIHRLPKYFKLFLFAFTVALSFGYFSGFKYLLRTNAVSPSAIETNYNGNEDQKDAEEMIFKMSERELLTIIHTHALSMSMIFVLLGGILSITSLPIFWKKILLVEPFLSVICTFGGIWLIWCGFTWLRYVVMISGMLMTLSFICMAAVIFTQLLINSNSRSK